MRTSPSLIALLFSVFSAAAQGVVVPGGGVVVSNVSPKPVYLRDLFQTALQPKDRAGMEGSPFINEEWLLARLDLPDNRVADSIFVKLNALDNKLHFKGDNDEEMEATINMKQITIIDNDPLWHGIVFRTGFGGDPHAFYRVIADGPKIQVLKKQTVIKWETKVLGEEDKRTLKLEEETYFAANGILYKPNKKCAALSDVFGDKKEAMLRFITTGELSCNKESDMLKMAAYFNSL